MLVVLGHRADGRPIAGSEWASLGAVVAGVAIIAATAPARTDIHAAPPRLALVMGALAVLVLAPLALRRVRRAPAVAVIGAAGLAAAWSGLATKLAADGLARGDLSVVLFWTATTGAAALVGLLNESTALQTLRPTQVVPAMLVLQMAVPVALAPFLAGESWTSAPAGGAPLAAALCVVTAGILGLASRSEVATAAFPPAADPGGHGCPPDGDAPGSGQSGRSRRPVTGG